VSLANGVNKLVAPAGDPGTIYAATREGAFRSTDRGETWSKIWSQLPDMDQNALSVAVSPADPSNLYLASLSGVFTSTDRGATWTQLPNLQWAFEVAVDPLRPSTLYAGGFPGLAKSVDGGLTWARASTGLPDTAVAEIMIDPVHPETLYLGTWFGVFRSTDGAASWALMSGLSDPVVALAFDPTSPATLYAGTQGGGVFDFIEVPSPPPGDYLTTEALPGFRFKVRISADGHESLPGRLESGCLPETLCVSGALPGRTELFVRISGPRPNGYFWVSLARLTPSQVEVWVEKPGTGERRYYRLDAVPRNSEDLPGRLDRTAFERD
jgi:hypothetical protein